MAAPKPTKTPIQKETTKNNPPKETTKINAPKEPTNFNPPKEPTQNNHTETSSKAISWADRVKVSDSTTRYTLDYIPQSNRDCQLEITDDMLTEHAEQWSRCMVGFFPGYRMNYHAVNKIASRVWRSHGLEDVRTTANGFIIFRFKKVDQMLELLERGPWLFGGKAIILQQWHPHFIFDKNKISKIPVWVRLHGLPFPLWSRKGLSLVASKVGRPLACDEATFTCSRLDFARVCVELDAATPFIKNFSVLTPLSQEPLNIEVDYEWKPPRCAKCHLFGHCCAKGDNGKTTVEVPSGGAVQEKAAELGVPVGKPSHVKGQVCAATEGTSDNSLHADMSEGHAAAGESQGTSQRSVASRVKDKILCPPTTGGKPTHPTGPSHEATGGKLSLRTGPSQEATGGKLTHRTGPSQEPTKQTKTPSENSSSSRAEASREPIQVSIAKNPDKGKEAIKDLESSEGDDISGKGILPKGKINTMATYNGQPSESEEDFEVDSSQVQSDQNDVETSYMAFATVKKKKGVKKKHKEARRL
ncbi:hypothetical protein OIU78_001695 [Salix suchowensis]|nr:hypothetical protein OIU78_001695 [Salix suchowensis]